MSPSNRSLFLSLVGLIASGCATISVGNPERVPFKGFGLAPGPDAQGGFSFYLQHPEASPLTLRTLKTGTLTVPVKGMLNPEDPKTKALLAATGPNMEVEVYVHWLRHSKAGDVLIDSGLDASFRKGGNIGGPVAGDFIVSSKLEPGQSVGEQLATLNLHPVAVLYTHLHGDHTAGTPELDKGMRFIAGKGDVYHNIPLLYFSRHLEGVKALEEVDPATCPQLPVLGRACDVFGDQTLFALGTPGHSLGHLSYLAMTPEGPVLLVGDASHTRYGWENAIEPGWADDRAQAIASLQRLQALVKALPGVTVIFGHTR